MFFLKYCIPCTTLKPNADQTDNGDLILEAVERGNSDTRAICINLTLLTMQQNKSCKNESLFRTPQQFFASVLKASRWKLKVIYIALF
jgi:hypothetical protein